MKVLDALDVDLMPANLLVPHYLMAGWLYERHNVSMMSDDAWDYLCSRLDVEFDDVTHPHLKHVDRDSLATATAQYLTDDRVPLMARGAAVQYAGGNLDAGASNEFILQLGKVENDGEEFDFG